MSRQSYAEKLRDPRWQKRRLELLQKSEFTCVNCGDAESELHIHHLLYERGKAPWEYEDNLLLPLCVKCHGLIDRIQKDITRQLAEFPPDCLADLQMALRYINRGHTHPFVSWGKWIKSAARYAGLKKGVSA